MPFHVHANEDNMSMKKALWGQKKTHSKLYEGFIEEKNHKSHHI
jgi:hypothetical protein